MEHKVRLTHGVSCLLLLLGQQTTTIRRSVRDVQYPIPIGNNNGEITMSYAKIGFGLLGLLAAFFVVKWLFSLLSLMTSLLMVGGILVAGFFVVKMLL